MSITTTAKALYARLESSRSSFLTRARECATYTLPTLVPPEGANGSTKYTTPWQGAGARGVNNLAAKLLLALLPPNSPFFRLAISDKALEEMQVAPGMRAKVEEALNKIERAVQSEVETSAIRVSAFEALKHLLIAGNVLLYLPSSGGMRVFHLDRYVVRRDAMGNVLDIITKETVDEETLPDEVKETIGESHTSTTDKSVDIYTHITRSGSKWVVYQEVKGVEVVGSRGSFPLDKSPWIAVRFSKVDGEDYGRSYVEEYLGDLRSLEGLTQAIVEGSAAASKVLFLVNPNGLTASEDLAEAENGAFVDGMSQDVSSLQLNKANDFQVALSTITQITERLSFAFLLNSAVQRSGERVTAEEIRYMAGELEATLGGIYSILSQEMQLPMVSRLMHTMQRAKKLPALPAGSVRPVIVTGLEALGRGNDLNKLQQFLQVITTTLGPDAVASRLNVGDAITRVGVSLGIEMSGLIKSDEQLAQEQQQAQQMQLMQQGVAPAINAGAKMMQQ